VVFSNEAARSWERTREGNFVFAGFLNTMPYLTQAAATNRDFHVFVASGLYDLTTTYYGTQYIFNQSGIEKDRLTPEDVCRRPHDVYDLLLASAAVRGYRRLYEAQVTAGYQQS
jgi:hypothetical protein